MEIVDRRENALLKRVEIEFIIRHENQPTPTRKSMTEWLNKLEPGSKKELVVINLSLDISKGRTCITTLYPSRFNLIF